MFETSFIVSSFSLTLGVGVCMLDKASSSLSIHRLSSLRRCSSPISPARHSGSPYQLFPDPRRSRQLWFFVHLSSHSQLNLEGSYSIYQPKLLPPFTPRHLDGAKPVRAPGLVRQMLVLWASTEKLGQGFENQLFHCLEAESWDFFVCLLCAKQEDQWHLLAQAATSFFLWGASQH